MKKSQLNAISRAYAEKNRKEQEQRAKNIHGFLTAFKYAGYKTLGGALANPEKAFTTAKKNIEKEIDVLAKEIERATVKGCKQTYIDGLNDKREHLERERDEIIDGGKIYERRYNQSNVY